MGTGQMSPQSQNSQKQTIFSIFKQTAHLKYSKIYSKNGHEK